MAAASGTASPEAGGISPTEEYCVQGGVFLGGCSCVDSGSSIVLCKINVLQEFWYLLKDLLVYVD
jgi:hypothetical protein